MVGLVLMLESLGDAEEMVLVVRSMLVLSRDAEEMLLVVRSMLVLSGESVDEFSALTRLAIEELESESILSFFSRKRFIWRPVRSGLRILPLSCSLGCQEWAGLPLICIKFRWLTPPDPPLALLLLEGTETLWMLICSPFGITVFGGAWDSLVTLWKVPDVDLYSKQRSDKFP